jgi:capsular exopolysaccharide synthesis family protein
MGGIGLALLLNMLDNSVRDPEEVERLAHLASLGLVPKVDAKTLQSSIPIELMSHYQRDQGLSESYRSIRTSLMFATPGGAPKTLMVTSATPGEGKTTSTVNLGIVLAQTGASVLLVDCDLRKPRLHKVFGVPRGPGLTEYLVQGQTDTYHKTPIEHLTLMASGTPPPNPAELLSSGATDRMLEALSHEFDYVILDSSPVMGLADPIVLATKVKGVLLVSGSGIVSRGALREAVKRLRAVDATLVGSLLNMVEPHSSEYGYYNRYYYNYAAATEELPERREAA